MRPNLRVATSTPSASLSRMEQLLSEYQSADRSSQMVLEKATKILFETSDPEKVAQANRAIKLSTEVANTAFLKLVSAKSENLADVLLKMKVWHETVAGSESDLTNLSPMEQLLCSAYEDIQEIAQL